MTGVWTNVAGKKCLVNESVSMRLATGPMNLFLFLFLFLQTRPADEMAVTPRGVLISISNARLLSGRSTQLPAASKQAVQFVGDPQCVGGGNPRHFRRCQGRLRRAGLGLHWTK